MTGRASGPLTGTRVLDMSRVLSGPYCAMSLSDMGADVIKVEHPSGGDDTRRFGPPFIDGLSTYYLSINRGKRSLALDLKSDEGRKIILRLIDWADVLLENFRPGAMSRLGLDYATCAERNPKLIYCSISAFGHAGDPEWSSKPGYDLILQGMGGIPSITGPEDGGPFKVGASIADVVSGMYATQGILLGLLARHRTGRGQHVDVSMLDGQVSLLTYLATSVLNTGDAPPRLGNRHLSIVPYGTYQAADGWLNIAVANPKQWTQFCGVMGMPSWEADIRFADNASRVAHLGELEALMEPILLNATVQVWIDRFTEVGIPAGPVLSIPETLAHPQLSARKMVTQLEHPRVGAVGVTGIPIQLGDTPGKIQGPPPGLGEHSDEILRSLGYLDSEITAFREQRIIA